MSSRKSGGSMSTLQSARAFSVADIQAFTDHSKIRVANRRLRKAFEAITGWKMTAKEGIPRDMFKLAVDYEDALGQAKEALILATRDWVLSRTCPLCGSRPQRTKMGKR
jgi:aldehyde:ferredoxin oxidoreductase